MSTIIRRYCGQRIYEPSYAWLHLCTWSNQHKGTWGCSCWKFFVGKVYGTSTGLYNKHGKYSKIWNPWHWFQSTHNVQQAKSFRQQMKSWIHHYLRCGQHNLGNESFQWAHALGKLLSELEFQLSDYNWIQDGWYIFGTLLNRDISIYIQFLLAHLSFQANIDSELMHFAASDGYLIISKTELGRSWVGYAGSTSCWSNHCAGHLFMQEDPLNKCLRQSECLVAGCHNCYNLKRCRWDTETVQLNSYQPDLISPKRCQKYWWSIT